MKNQKSFTPNLHIDYNDGPGSIMVRKEMLRNVAAFAGKNPEYPGHRNVQLNWDETGRVSWFATSALSSICLQHGKLSDPPLGENVPRKIHFAKNVFSRLLLLTKSRPPDYVNYLALDADKEGTEAAYPVPVLVNPFDSDTIFNRAEIETFPFSEPVFMSCVENIRRFSLRQNGAHIRFSKDNLKKLVRMVRAIKALESNKNNAWQTTELQIESKARHRTELSAWRRNGKESLFLGEIDVLAPNQFDLFGSSVFISKRLYFILDTVLRMYPDEKNIDLYLPDKETGLPACISFDLQHDPAGRATIIFNTLTPLPYVKTRN